MNVLVFASRKGGSGKSTLASNLAALAHTRAKPCLLIDADPQGSSTLWHRLRAGDGPDLRSVTTGLSNVLAKAKSDGYAWAFVDTPPTKSAAVSEAIKAATLVVIPSRPTIFDLTAVKDTIDLAREFEKPYAVIINSAPPKREEIEAPIVSQARLGLSGLRVPVWPGQITNRAAFALAPATGQTVAEFDAQCRAAAEMNDLWSALMRSVRALSRACDQAA
jgi:chromosome partitioning protein